ncbi:LacI family DNA-binding transcriptional regulator [Martelella sp. AD-3]|uniref:LacI family DNA-binding transcriptional regulator n=1 Tax=Martelella sp. AD-3 TaxID=686597 RepID=UPI0004655C1F|nr:LacI family DNA-binding transcriptional regulator [Martelella sp. AD-3]AMM86901.1 LacI family transcriptional regulator [Martelella sp. AD-3]MAM08973.1 LacI family transcriptional regulator [Rhizobiaceae bacterium]
MRPTVHDIAAEAGVSLATVDRVMNARPGVREKTKVKVEQAIEKLGYVRDVAAANLAKGRTYPFTFILPCNENAFMGELRDAVLQANERGRIERTQITIVDVPAFDAEALAEALVATGESNPAGIAVVAIQADPVREAVRKLTDRGIPVVTLVSDLEDSTRDHYAGVDNPAAGRTAATLLGRFLSRQKGTIGVLAGSLSVRDHQNRFSGFSEIMAAHFPELSILPPMEGRDDSALARKLVCEAVEAHPDMIGLYSLGAGNRGLIAALEEARTKGRELVTIAHELSAHSREALETGLFDVVLNQDAGHEVRSAIRVLKAKADGLEVIAAQERIRIDIFIKDNLP